MPIGRRWTLFVILSVAIALIVVVAVVFSSGAFVGRTVDYTVARLVDVSGMNPFLVKGLVILATIPFFWAVARYTGTVVGYWRLGPSLDLYTNRYGIIIVSYVAAFFLSMFAASREGFVGHSTGDTLKWCAESVEGIRVFDSPGFDPVYGTALRPCTEAEKIELRAKERGLVGARALVVADPSSFEFFDTLSRRPKVWYHRSPTGAVELFDRAGVHPRSGEPLKAITSDVVAHVIEQARLQKLNEEAEAVRLTAEKKRQLDEEVRLAEAARRADVLQKYINEGRANPTVPAVVGVDANGHFDIEIAGRVSSAVDGASDFFKPTFVSDGSFARAFQGDASQLLELGVNRMTSAVILLSLASQTSQATVAGETVVRAETTATMRIFRSVAGFPSRVVRVVAHGTALSAAQAERDAREAVLQQAGTQLKNAL